LGKALVHSRGIVVLVAGLRKSPMHSSTPATLVSLQL
jgi:hypothetical protein